MEKSEQKINCNVESCKFQNENLCTLKEILVDNCGVRKVNDSLETFCESFKAKKKK